MESWGWDGDESTRVQEWVFGWKIERTGENSRRRGSTFWPFMLAGYGDLFCGEEGMSGMGRMGWSLGGDGVRDGFKTGVMTRVCVMDGKGWLEGIGGTMHASSP